MPPLSNFYFPPSGPHMSFLIGLHPKSKFLAIHNKKGQT